MSATRIRPRPAGRRPARRRSRSRPGRGRRPSGATRGRASPRSCRRTRRSDARARSAPPFTFTICLVDAEQARGVARDRREGLVDLDPGHVGGRAARLLERERRRPSPACARGRRSRPRSWPARRSSRARRARVRARTRSEHTTTHEAPSFTPGALPAVVVPSSVEDRLQRGQLLERSCRARMLSSRSSSPTGTISSASRPASSAAAARSCERAAHASWASRVMPSSRATTRRLHDHVVAVERRRRARRRPCGRAPRRSRAGSRSGLSGSRYGAFDIDSIPPVTTTSCCPARIIRSASSIARIDDAHTLLIVSAGTSFGMPGADGRLAGGRLPGTGLEHLTHDDVPDLCRIDPAIARARPGSRSHRARSPGASREPPPSLPKGVRTAATMTERLMIQPTACAVTGFSLSPGSVSAGRTSRRRASVRRPRSAGTRPRRRRAGRSRRRCACTAAGCRRSRRRSRRR